MRSRDCASSRAGDSSSFTTFESLGSTCKSLVNDDIGLVESVLVAKFGLASDYECFTLPGEIRLCATPHRRLSLVTC